MKSLLISSLFTFIGTLSFAQPKTVDKIVAQIGDEIILLSDIESQKIQAVQSEVEMTDKVECDMLEGLMYQLLLQNQAKLDSIPVNDAQVDAEMEQRIRVIEAQIGGRQKLEAYYQMSVTEIKERFREIIRDQLLAKEMERQITTAVNVTPREVEKFFAEMPKDSIPYINSKLSFQQIVIYPEITSDDKKKAFDQLNDIRREIVEEGKEFSTMAILHSMDPGSAKEGGKIAASKGMMVPQFEANAFKMEKGEVSDIFETDYGYHILKLIDRKGDDYVVRHILIIPEFSDDAITKAAYKIDTCHKRLVAGEITWEEAVLQYSNDENTRLNKGIITNPMTGDQEWEMDQLSQVDQQIYLLTDRLEVGQYSEAALYTNYMERKEGVRIVKLMSRRPPHKANLIDDYSLIQGAALNTKQSRVIQDWTTSKIKNAYVKIDPDFHSCVFNSAWLSD